MKGRKTMKKVFKMMLCLMMIFSLFGCGDKTTNDANTSQNQSQITVLSVDTVDELEEKVLKDVEDTKTNLKQEQETLSKNIDTYEKYINNIDKIKAYYQKTIDETNQLGIRLREYSYQYAQLVIQSNQTNKDKYKDLKGIYDCIYEDAGKDMYDIYEDIVKDMYDIYYDGILKDAYQKVDYDEWYDVLSDDYDIWSDTLSEIYDLWSDMKSDIYDFQYDIRSEIYDNNMERVEKKMEEFKEDIFALKKK